MKWFVINFNIFVKPQKLRSETAWGKLEKSKSERCLCRTQETN